MKRSIILSLLALLAALWFAPAQAARTFTITQVSPALGTAVDMGSAQAVTFSVQNTSGGSNAGERIYEMRFRLPGTGTVFASSTAAPAGWTRTAFSTTSVTFRASSWANSIVSGSSLSFTLNMVMRTTTADVTETLRDARASFTLDTNFTNGVTRTGRTTVNNPGSWALRSLKITSFQITDTGGIPVSAIAAGSSFRLVMTVQNISSATLSNITSSSMTGASCNGSAPTAYKPTGTVTQGLTTTAYSPNPLTLATGASGTITFTYTTQPTDSGTIYFTGYACNSAKTTAARPQDSSTLSVSAFAATLSIVDATTNAALPGSCAYVNQTLKVRMGLINNFPYSITGITATMTPTVGGVLTLVSGPTYSASPLSISANTTMNSAVEWTYQITGGTSGQLFAFTGSANGTASGGGGGPRTAPPVTSSPPIKRGGFDPIVNPANTNALSTNAEINWGITNNGCAAVKSVSITVPAGFSWNGDAYSLVNSTDESWTVSGGNPVTFTAPAAVNYLPLTFDADYYLVLSTPATPGTYTFDLGVTDSNDVSSTRSTTLTVDPFNTGSPSLNRTAPGPWREQYQ